MNKRILYINESLGTGSVAGIIEQLGLRAQALGYTCMVAHGARYVGPSRLPHFSFSSKAEEYTHGAISLFGNAHGLGSCWATRRLIAFIQKYQPSLIHLHNIHGYYLNYPLLFAFLKQADMPVVWTLHDCWALTGRCAHFTLSACNQWKTQCRTCPIYYDYPRSVLHSGTQRNFEFKKHAFNGIKNLTITTVSEWLHQQVTQSLLQAYPCQTILNGIDINCFSPQPSDWRKKWNAENKIVLLGVASQWTETKGWSDWIKLAQWLDDSYRIVLIGVNEQQKRQLPSNCIAISHIADKHEMAKIYSAADVYVNLAHQEAFGLTLVEAMSCGTPCVSYNNTAIPETTTPDTCVVVPDGDLDAVIATIKAQGSSMKAERGEMCRQHVLSHFNEEEKIEEYMELYSRLS